MAKVRDPNNLERDRRKRAARDPHFLERRRKAYNRYAASPANKDKIKARNKIKHLCRVGKVVRGNCEGCGKPNGEAHHDDYSRPLDVRWFCRRCHVRHHQSEAAGN